MKMIKDLIKKYKELIIYVIFGALTTVVNFVVFKIFNVILGNENYLISNVIAWIFAVIFAYITNKLWVFESKSWSGKVLLKEIPSFFSARVLSFLIEEAGLFIFVDLLKFNEFVLDLKFIRFSGEMVAKLILAVIVVILNYFFSKLFIFKKKKENNKVS